MLIKITVITVCYNAEQTIRRTMKSVLDQSYTNIEYLIIDGKSTDNTLSIAETIRQENKNRDIQIYCERDFGIYNAMNRGIVRASGDYVIFLNSGDLFCDNSVLERAAHMIRRYGYGIYYGIAYKVYKARIIGKIDYGCDRRPDLIKLLNAFAPNHQATLAPLACMKKFYFDETYKYCADLDWIIRCYRHGIRLINMDYLVCRFDVSGISHRADSISEGKNDIYKMLKKNFPVLGRFAIFFIEIR